LPLELAKMTVDFHVLDERDYKRVENVKILTDLLNERRINESQGNDRVNTRKKDNFPLGKIVQETYKRRQAFARIGLRFGESLANVQAERLRERSSKSELLAKELGLRSADTLDALAETILYIDNRFSAKR